MNEIVYKSFLAGNKFIPEMHLSQPRFTVFQDHLIKAKNKKTKNKNLNK